MRDELKGLDEINSSYLWDIEPYIVNLVGDLSTGAEIRLSGRLQSREYEKRTPNGIEKRTAYEVSVNRICDPNKRG